MGTLLETPVAAGLPDRDLKFVESRDPCRGGMLVQQEVSHAIVVVADERKTGEY